MGSLQVPKCSEGRAVKAQGIRTALIFVYPKQGGFCLNGSLPVYSSLYWQALCLKDDRSAEGSRSF